MVDGPMILAVVAHNIENPNLNSSRCEPTPLRASHKTVLEFGSDARPLGCICGTGCVHKRQNITGKSTRAPQSTIPIRYSRSDAFALSRADTWVQFLVQGNLPVGLSLAPIRCSGDLAAPVAPYRSKR